MAAVPGFVSVSNQTAASLQLKLSMRLRQILLSAMLWFQPDNNLLSSEQCRACRAVLQMTATQTAEAAGLSAPVIIAYEDGSMRPADVSAKLKAMFEQHGIVFAEDGFGLTWRRAIDPDID